MKNFFKNLRIAYIKCWDSDVTPIWVVLHILISVLIICIAQLYIEYFIPILLVVIIISSIIGCLAANWENDEN